MPDTARWKTWTDPVDVVARALDDVATAAAANAGAPSAAALRSIAGEVLDELLAEPVEPPPVVERDEDAVRLVEDIIDATSDVSVSNIPHRVPTERTGPAIVEALFGRPTVSLPEDGRIVIDWQDTPTHRPRACIVARDLLDDIVERLNGERTPSEPVENHAVVDVVIRSNAALRDFAGLAELTTELGAAIAASDAARTVADAAPPLATLSPDCRAGKCTACNGDAWSDRLDAHTDCEHPCHTRRVHPEGGLVPLGESGVSKSPDGTR